MRNPIFVSLMVLLLVLTLGSFFLSGPSAWLVGFVYIAYDSFLLVFIAVQMSRIILRERVNGDRERSTNLQRPSVAVLITARNESRVAESCLHALECQTDPPETIYWIDDGSTDNTKDILQQMSFALKLTTIIKGHSGKARSLNHVWPTVTEDVIVTLDADTLLSSTAIAEIRMAFAKNPKLAATGGLLTPKSLDAPRGLFETFQRFEYLRSFLSRRVWMEKQSLLLVSGAFAAYRKHVLEAVGGFDPDSLVEDYDLIHRIHRWSFSKALNYQVNVTVAAHATTDVPAHLTQFLKQRKRWFGGFLQTHFKNTDMVANRRFGNLGTLMMVIKTADTLQPLYGLASLGTLIYILLRGRSLELWILGVLVGKILLDLGLHYASVSIYYRWRNQKTSRRVWVISTIATVLEPFSFQILRHIGAVLGWVIFLTNRNDWAPQRAELKSIPAKRSKVI